MTLSDDLSYLLYRSRAILPEDDMSNLDILRVAMLFNAANSITGFLCRDEGFFAQVLEGPRQVIEDLLARIRTDPRHENVELLETGPIEKRQFPQWSMGYAQATILPQTTIGKMKPEELRDLLKTASLAQGKRVIYNMV